jgi:hypothetical protein
MLIFVRSFVNNKKISLDVEPATTVQEVIAMVERIQPEIIIKRVLFAGQVLQPQNTLQSYNIIKECSLQLMGARKAAPVEEKKDDDALPGGDDDMPPPGSPAFARQKTAPSVQFGDVLVVELVGARKLKKSDYWSNSSDPYVILNLGSQTARSSVVSSKFVVDKLLNADAECRELESQVGGNICVSCFWRWTSQAWTALFRS